MMISTLALALAAAAQPGSHVVALPEAAPVAGRIDETARRDPAPETRPATKPTQLVGMTSPTGSRPEWFTRGYWMQWFADRPNSRWDSYYG